MSNTQTQTANKKQKKFKITLDRILSIKKSIMDSINLLSKHDKSSSLVQGNNTVPKGKGKELYRKVTNNVDYGGHISQTTADSNQYSNHINNITYFPGGHPQTACMHRNQTWPHDDYSAQILLQDQYPAQIPIQNCTQTAHTHCMDQPAAQHCKQTVGEEITCTHTNSIMGHMKNQEIQTDTTEMFDVNADIIKYLSQFNDKAAFRLYAPVRVRQSGGLSSYCEYDYSQNGYCNYNERFQNRRVPRIHDANLALGQRGLYTQNVMCRPQYEQHPFACFEQQVYNDFGMSNEQQQYHGFGMSDEQKMNHGFRMPDEQQMQHCYGVSNDQRRQHWYGLSNEQRRQHRYVMSNERQTQYRSENIKRAPDTSDVDYTNIKSLRAPPRADTRASSGDSGSILSSETDSDFTFYPCSSLAQHFQRMTLVDSRNTSFLSPPSDMPENINTNFSWRSDFYGSSLDEVTLQFFLDDDVLSDDVFIDDYELTYAMNTTQNPQGQLQDDTEAELVDENSRICDMSHQSDLDCIFHWGEEVEHRESYGDNCYAYRYADIDEVLNSHKEGSQEDEQSEVDQTIENPFSPVTRTEEYIPLSSYSDVQCSSEDHYLTPSHEFSNVFDSLRRNSTQTKARKMWRQRRAKSKKNPTEASNAYKKQQSSLCQPTVFTFDNISLRDQNPIKPPPKPLRGILKNKVSNTFKQWQSDLQPDQVTDAKNSSVEITKNFPGIFMLDVNFKSHPQSPCVYASMSKRVSSVRISNIDEVVEDCIQSVLNKLPEESHSSFTDMLDTVDNEISPSGVSEIGHVDDIKDNCSNYSSSYNSELLCENQEKEKLSPSIETNHQFHLILSPETDGSSKIIAVRKNSLEAYEWTRSLKRRQGRLARKANGDISAACKEECRPSRSTYRSGEMSAASI